MLLPNFTHVFRLLVICSSFLHASFAQNNSDPCYDGDFETFNATSSVEIFGMHAQAPLKGSLGGHYVLSTAVKEIVDLEEIVDLKQNISITKQKFWLKAEPAITTPPLELPFAGCAFFFQAAPGSSLIGANPADNLCQNVLPGDCENTLIDVIQNNVSLLPQSALDNNFETCATLRDFLQTPPAECAGAEWDNVIAIRRWFLFSSENCLPPAS